MKKTTYIEGLKLIYSDRVIDRSDGTRTRRGVDQANRQDQAEADAQANTQTNAQAGRGPAEEADCLSTGLDERGLWHTPNPELIEDAPTLSWESLRNGCILGGIFWAIVITLIYILKHADQIDRWRP